MSLTGLRTALSKEPTFANVYAQASRPAAERSAETVIGAADGLRAPLVAQVSDGLAAAAASGASGAEGGHVPVVLAVTATDREAEDLETVLGSYLDPAAIARFPAWETLPHERLSPRSDTVGRRLAVLRRLAEAGDGTRIVIAPVRSVLQPIAASLESMRPVRLAVGEEQDFEEVVEALSAAAYSRVDLVTKRGEFAVRGGILDVFSPVEDHPVRIEFFGDEVERMRWFAVADQRTLSGEGVVEPVEMIAPPCREVLITPGVRARAAELKDRLPGAESMLERIADGIYVEGMESLAPLLVDRMTTLTASLPPDSLALVCEPEKVRSRAADLVATNEEFLVAAWEQASDGQAAPIDLAETGLAEGGFRSVSDARTEALDAGLGWWSITSLGVDEAIEQDADTLTIAVRAPLVFAGDVEALLKVVADHVREEWQVVAVTEGPGPLKRLTELFQEAGLPAARREDLVEEPQPGIIELTTAAHGTGFVLEEAKIALLTEADILGKASPYTTRDMRKLPARRRRNAVDPLALKAGDHVVHEQHGIGQFVELIQRPVAGAMVKPGQPKPVKEYLVLEYAPSKRGAPRDRLFVPTDQLDQVSNYVGGDAPTLSKMGGSDWSKTKSKARKAVKEIAADLIRLYSARMASKGHAFGPDTPWQRELEEAFPYVETPDQLTTINEVKADMEKEIPMDRLISGDVGYGKTEIAVRAAFKAVQDGKQVALLVPTTLLAQQHTETFAERFSGFPVRVATLSRFQTAKEAKAVEAGIADGSVDVVIGTHRLLSTSISFKDLGLVIIDEEQRFGVEHKEKLKTLRTNVDVLAMSATPIPRTLEMSLTGIRETSTLATPPEERHPVLTYVGPNTEKQITAAVRRELMREGQVFYVHNRVSSIERVAADLQKMVPEARIAVAHGQMSESRLEQIIVDFWEKRFDVLVCTTIVETGLDISNANTLIVDRANNYGLSQLHQLRGRVGRGRDRAYAYFVYPVEKPLGEVALERLKAVAAHNELGSGMQLAMKDLEIRGAGNLLGGEQSGHIQGVGFDLYLRLVGEAVADYRGDQEEAAPAEMKIELPVDAHLPHDYVPGERLRLEAYRNLAAVTSEEGVAEVAEELEDRYGALPAPAQNLLKIARLRLKARTVGLTELMVMGPKVRFYPVDLPDSKQMRLERMYPGSLVKVVPGTERRQVLVPKPKSAPVGGKDLVDDEILEWAGAFIDAILA
ncbi:transcription-repair coupling factor [Rothia halotolerans]|uniref:transcription-repair coupling factor n=1 Tax=Rothia halotolerans TaxID=405770 RepID=UPI00101C986A|nr:transcription-repair coupling factor [Rothia halotolerans]